jgi:hypothetical protein
MEARVLGGFLEPFHVEWDVLGAEDHARWLKTSRGSYSTGPFVAPPGSEVLVVALVDSEGDWVASLSFAIAPGSDPCRLVGEAERELWASVRARYAERN